MTAALRSARKQRDANLRVRPIAARDDAAMAAIIRDVFREYGMDKMEGVSLHDPDLDRLTGLYRDNGGHYWVLERDGQVVGASAWRRWRAKSPAIASCKAVLQTRRAWAGHGALYGGAGAEGGAGGGYRYCYGNHRTVERGDRVVLRAGIHAADGTARQHWPSRLQRVHAEKS